MQITSEEEAREIIGLEGELPEEGRYEPPDYIKELTAPKPPSGEGSSINGGTNNLPRAPGKGGQRGTAAEE
jgi:hypothetical protein